MRGKKSHRRRLPQQLDPMLLQPVFFSNGWQLRHIVKAERWVGSNVGWRGGNNGEQWLYVRLALGTTNKSEAIEMTADPDESILFIHFSIGVDLFV